MKNSLILLITLFLFSSCKKQENNDFDINSTDISLNVYLLNQQTNTKVTVTALTDDGPFSFVFTENIFRKKFKAKKGFTFIVNCPDPNVYMNMTVDGKKGNVVPLVGGNTLITVSSK